MKKEKLDRMLNSLIEDLAAIEHERWSHWQRYMHANAKHQEDGSLLLSPELVQRWEAQMSTKYIDLNESEKESDREQVRRYLPLIATSFMKEISEE